MPLGSGIDPNWLSSDPEMIEDTVQDELFLRKATPRRFFSSLQHQQEVMRRAAEITVPMLVFSGDQDRLAEVSAMRSFHDQATSEDKRYQCYPSKRHELLRETDREQVFQDIHHWLLQRLNPTSKHSD